MCVHEINVKKNVWYAYGKCGWKGAQFIFIIVNVKENWVVAKDVNGYNKNGSL